MTSYRIPFIKPTFPSAKEIAADIDEITSSNWYTNFGPKERSFSKELASYLGGGVSVSTMANGTFALLAAGHAVFGPPQPGRFILMPSFTFIAVAQAAIWNGYRPWFIDIDPVTWQASASSARTVLEENREQIAGIILPNALGVGNPNVDDWQSLAVEWDLPLVIDSAAGFGSEYTDGRKLGTKGMCEIFSFHATKPFAIGEGGALASADFDLVESVNSFQNFGFSAARVSVALGMNGKLSELGAAIGLRQLEGFDKRLASRRATFGKYCAALRPLELAFQPNADASSNQCCTVVCASPAQKGSVMTSLDHYRVQARDYYNSPLHRHPYFSGDESRCLSTDLSVTEDICSRVVSLPIYDEMPECDLALVVRAVTEGAS